MVESVKTPEDLENILKGAPTTKLVVLEFVKQGNQVCSYVKPEVERIAKEMKEQHKADFYTLDVNNFKKYAEKFHVEALPAFVLMQKFVKKKHVVGTDELQKAINQVHDKIARKSDDESGQVGNSGTQAQSGDEENTGPKTESAQEENTGPNTTGSINQVSSGEPGSRQTCGIL